MTAEEIQACSTDIIIRELREAAKGRYVWRVQLKDTGAYLIEFRDREAVEARIWWLNYQKNYPTVSKKYELGRVHFQTSSERLMLEAADRLERLVAFKAVKTWNQCAIRSASIAASGILQRFEAECLSRCQFYRQQEHAAKNAIERRAWRSLRAGIGEAVGMLQRLTACPDAGLQFDHEAMRDSIKQLADEWCVHASNGLDVLASQCLDEIEAQVQAVRP